MEGKIRKISHSVSGRINGTERSDHQGNEITKIWTDSFSSVMTVLDPHTPHQLVRDIQSLLTQNRNILVRWVKAHAGYRGNEEADTLAQKAIIVVMKALKPSMRT
ncbi:hypothetical protein AVEN_226293-1 [Araneus ventricosus]|uniref:RNase H type-1 domain-containing protein n=1 Tax=Araneus ventricosus TaxID=182803 RepID=A0A4Y2D9E2_ARAVE|nr:hypothetical protein AVEN_226293-1 [Araneus ventricosus]